jgi:hypothetical protein
MAFTRQTVQPSGPAVLAANDGRLDEEGFPFPRRTQGAGDNGNVVGIGLRVDLRLGPISSFAPTARSLAGGPEGLVFGARPDLALRWRGAARVECRHLSKRQIFRKAVRGEPLDRARKQRQKRAAGRVGSLRATREVHRHVGTPQCVLQQARIDLWCPQHDRNLVEADALAGLVEHHAGNLDTLTSLTGRGEEADLVVRFARGWVCLAEQILAQAGQTRRRLRGLGGNSFSVPQRKQCLQGALISRGNGDKDARRVRNQGSDELAFGRAIQRNVQQQERDAHKWCPGGDRRCRCPKQRGPIGHRRASQLLFMVAQQDGELWTRRIQRGHGPVINAGEPQFVERCRECAGEAGIVCDRSEVRDACGLQRFEGGSRRNSLHSKHCRLCKACMRELGLCEMCGQLGQCEAMEPKCGARGGGELADEIINCLARRAEKEHLGGRWGRMDEAFCRVQTSDCRVGSDDANHGKRTVLYHKLGHSVSLSPDSRCRGASVQNCRRYPASIRAITNP